MKNIENPIKQIGESEWVNKLTTFLKEFDIEVLPLEDKKEISQTEKRLDWSMPNVHPFCSVQPRPAFLPVP